MNPRILIAYATRTGSTPGVAAAIGETLSGRGYTVDVKPIEDNPDPALYQAVIVGSAVNGGKWLPEAVTFVQRHQSTLRQAPLAYFCVHILNLGADESSQKNRRAYLDEARALAAPAAEAFFSGKGMDPKDTNPILLWIMRVTKFMPEGDCRDWTKIKAWGQALFA
jgi:menaquinone-dependent protoporphyrinogen oxidase